MDICVYVCMYVYTYMYICMYICMHIYIYIYICMCYEIAEGFQFMPLSLVWLRPFWLSTWVGWV